jgi:tripartite motif-containing protein 71
MRATVSLMLRLIGAVLLATLPGVVSAGTPTADEATPSPGSLATFAGFFGDDVLQQPSSIAVGPDGSVWVTDLGTDQVHQFDAEGNHLLSFGESGEGPGQFEFADFGAVDLDGDGNVYVLDTGYQRVQKFTPDLEFELQWGENGSNPGEYLHPSDIAVREDGTVFVVDAMSGKVQQFDSSGAFVQEIVPTGISTEFLEPVRASIDSANNLYVPDITRIYVFDPDGRHIRTIRTNEIDNGTVGLLMDVEMSKSGFIYASDVQFSKITVFDPDGAFVGTWGSPGASSGQFVEVDDLVFDSAGQLLVLDFGNQRIQIFELAEPPYATPVATPV